jgi:hypothetical protein
MYVSIFSHEHNLEPGGILLETWRHDGGELIFAFDNQSAPVGPCDVNMVLVQRFA